MVKQSEESGTVAMLVKSSPTAAALLIMFWMGTNFLEKNLVVQNEMMKKQQEFNASQNQFNERQNLFNQSILKAVDEIAKGMADIHADVNTKTR